MAKILHRNFSEVFISYTIDSAKQRENEMLKMLSLMVLIVSLGFTSACSKKDDDDHFLKEQQQSLEKAKAVEGMLMDNEKRKREQSEQE